MRVFFFLDLLFICFIFFSNLLFILCTSLHYLSISRDRIGLQTQILLNLNELFIINPKIVIRHYKAVIVELLQWAGMASFAFVKQGS